MGFASKIDVFLSTSSVAVPSRDGDLVVLEGDLGAVDIPKLCRLDLQESAEVSLLQLDLEASVAVFVEALAAVLAVAASGVSAVVIAAALAAEEVALDTKVEAVLVVEEVGMAVDRPMATVMAQQHLRMHLLALAETAVALAVVMVALL